VSRHRDELVPGRGSEAGCELTWGVVHTVEMKKEGKVEEKIVALDDEDILILRTYVRDPEGAVDGRRELTRRGLGFRVKDRTPSSSGASRLISRRSRSE
jgi:hypothetical protein